MKRFWVRRKPREEAAQFLADSLSGRFDAAADRAWQKWMQSDAAHRDAFDRAQGAWSSAALVEDRPRIQALLKDIDADLRRRAQTQDAARPGRRWQPIALGATAMALVLAVIALWPRNPVTSSATYVTAVGEQRVVTLEDKSTVALNTGTTLRVVYRRKSRDVELVNGEAAFTVTPNASRPFAVRALQGSSVAVGTRYSVHIVKPDTVDVSVVEGVVDVKPAGNATAAAQRLTAGRAVSYTGSGAISPVRAADLERIQGWQSQRLVFNDLSLADALAEFNRYRSTPVVLGSARLATRRISGVYRIGEDEAFLNALQQLYQVRVRREGTQIVLE